MGIELEVVESADDLKAVAQELLEKKIHHPVGLLPHIYQRITSGLYRRVILIVARVNRQPVGVIFYRLRNSTAHFYVLPDYRRKGIASQMVKKLRDQPCVGSRVIEGEGGDLGWEEFFKSTGIFCTELVTEQLLPVESSGKSVSTEGIIAGYRKNLARVRRSFKRNYLLSKEVSNAS